MGLVLSAFLLVYAVIFYILLIKYILIIIYRRPQLFNHPSIFKYSLISLLFGIVHMLILLIIPNNSSLCYLHLILVLLSHFSSSGYNNILFYRILFVSIINLYCKNSGRLLDKKFCFLYIIPVTFLIIMFILYFVFNDENTVIYRIEYSDKYFGECFRCKHILPFFIYNFLYV